MRAKNSTNAVQNSHHELFYEARLASPRIRLALIIAYHRFINCPQCSIRRNEFYGGSRAEAGASLMAASREDFLGADFGAKPVWRQPGTTDKSSFHYIPAEITRT